MPAGTRIEVRHLFYNTPVRRKFLRTATTETGHICEIFTRAALANPGIHLTLKHNGKHVYEVASSTQLLERIGLFFGADVRDQLYAIDAKQGPAHLFGYVADPACGAAAMPSRSISSSTAAGFATARWVMPCRKAIAAC